MIRHQSSSARSRRHAAGSFARRVPKAPVAPSAEMLSLFVDFAPAAMAMFDTKMRYLVVNQRWRADFSLGDQEIIGRSHYELFPDLPEHWKAIHRRCLAGAVEKCDEDRYVRADGEVYWLRWEVRPWRDSAGRVGGLIFFSENITARKLLEIAMLESTTREQQRLGRDLHDGLGQELTGISLLARALADTAKSAGYRDAAALDELAWLSQHAIAGCRAIAHGQSPLEMSGGNLVGALRELMELQKGTFGVDFAFEVSNEDQLRLGDAAQENLYRMAQESVANARRHASANSIHLTLSVQSESVKLDILDDGVGYTGTNAKSPGIGIKAMRVRAGLIGARLYVGKGINGGTLVSVECPQPPAPHKSPLRA